MRVAFRVLVLAALLAACNAGPTASSGPSSSPGGATPTPPAPASASAPVGSSASAPPSGASVPSGTLAPAGSSVVPPASGSAGLAVVDPGLLAVLPATIAGGTLDEFSDAEHAAAADPDLGRNVSRIATAFVGDPSGKNWAYTAVVDVRPQSRTDLFYRDWQETFDESACAQAGGVTGHTTVDIAGRSVERTACGGGVRTYHVRIDGTGILISISDLGDLLYGEQVIAGLRP